MEKANEMLDQEKLDLASEILRAIAHPLRLKIVEFIDNNEQINVNKIYNALKLEQSITSQHLRILRDVDLVNTDKDGKYVNYTLDYARIKNVITSINAFAELTQATAKVKKSASQD